MTGAWTEILEKKVGEYVEAPNIKFSVLMEMARKNFVEINKATEGKSNTVEVLKKGQIILRDKMKSQKENLMKHLDDQYKSIYSENEYNKAKVDEFQKSMNQILDEIGDKTSQQYKETIAKLKSYVGKTKEDFNTYYVDMKAKLNTTFDEAINKVQL